SITWEKASYWPDFQGEYGPGSDNGFGEFSYWLIKEANVPEGFPTKSNGGRGSWGEKYDANKLRNQYNSYNHQTGEWSLTPFVYADDWYKGFLETGVTYRNNVTVTSNNGKGQSARLSITDTRNDWILPNTGYQNQNVSFAFNTKMNKWIKFSARANYLHKASDNMPVSGYNTQSPFYMLIWGATNIHPYQYAEEYFSGRCDELNYSTNRTDGVGMISRMGNSKPFNPYRQMYEATNAINKDRVYGNVALTFNFPVKGLTLDLRAGTDLSVDFRQTKKPFRSPGYEQGFYREQNNRDIETNIDFLLRYANSKLFAKRLDLNVAFGGNTMSRRAFRNRTTVQNLGEEGVYNTTNIPDGEFARTYNARNHKVVNSFYGFVNLGWDNTYFLDLTARNDWSSALARGNWSFFYPSVSASVLLDQALKISESAPWVDMLKVRASWANVGNDTDPYGLVDAYAASTTYPSSYLLPTSISNYYIKPENVESWEAGVETRFFRNRLGLDVAVYQSSTTNQIVSAITDMFIGASSRKMNAGEIRNRGVEVALHVTPVQTRNFTWTFDVNWSRNWNKLVSLEESWDPKAAFIQNSGAAGSYASIRSYVGEEMYWIYGKGYKRAPADATYIDADGNEVSCAGMKMINPVDGLPYLDDTADTRIAKVNPTWTGGMVHNFRYKNFSLGLTFSAQMGGHSYSNTEAVLAHLGKLKSTLNGRYDSFLVEGVIATEDANGKVTYTPNTKKVTNVMNYYQSAESRDNAEQHTFKTDFFKLTEARFDYTLPKKVCRKLRVLQGAQLGVYATNVFCISDWPQFDPEAGTLNGTNIVKGAEMGALPMTRTYGVNIKLSF
ncbi:MAG: TonB-dependent receptor, partial [Muribaculaceae bacterium]|nr:TonB-dependent receptor [Muribaculaceae bacterium]